MTGHFLRLILPGGLFYRWLQQADDHGGQMQDSLSLGILQIENGQAALLGLDARTIPEQTCILQLRLVTHQPSLDQWCTWLRADETIHFGLAVSSAGQLWGVSARFSDVQPIEEIRLNGPGMLRFRRQAENDRTLSIEEQRLGYWSRLQAALGADAHARLRALHPAIIGVSRNGSLMASTLVRMGIQQLSLIDPDQVKAHLVDAMDVITAADIGQFKVNAVSSHLMDTFNSPIVIHTYPQAVWTPRVITGLKAVDLIIACVDDDAARLFSGILAHHLGVPLLDIGSGVFRQRMGGDIRLILPGENLCLSCMGGVRRLGDIDTALGLLKHDPISWQQQRSGSLRSLNQINVHLGMRLIEDLVNMRQEKSIWLHFEWEPGTTPRLSRSNLPRVSGCHICASSGGEGALEQLRQDMIIARYQIQQWFGELPRY